MDYYAILGVPRDATDSVIKKAYRELSFNTHPDRNSSPDASTKMQQLNEAYETLKDPQKRHQYDMGQNPLENIFGDLFRQGPGPMHPFARHMHTQMNPNMNPHMNPHAQMNPHIQIFEMMHQMGNMNMGEPMIFHFDDMQPIQPLETVVELTFEQAVQGHSLPITITRNIVNGMQRSKETEKIYVTIPAGIDHGEILEIPEKGHHHQNKKGLLKVHIHVKPHEVFERKGLHLFCQHTLDFKESICGFDFTLTLLDGSTIKLKSSPGHIIQNMDEKVIKGKGIHRDGGEGDLLIKFRVFPPKVLTDEQVALFSNLL